VSPTRPSTLLVLFLSVFSASIAAQNAQPTAVPTMVRFSGNLKDANGKPLSGIAGLTFALYTDEQGGVPLWLETQNVQLDANGDYTVPLGATKPDGLPIDLFVSGDARWLGVQPQGQPEQPRVLLLAVPYALKAADAETVGGLPPSAFVRAELENGDPTKGPSGQAVSGTSSRNSPPQPNMTVMTPGGAANFMPLWTGTATIGNSTLFQSGSNVGIGTTTPAAALDVSGAIIQRGAAANNMNGYMSTNANLAGSMTELDPGLLVSQNVGYRFGTDLGFSSISGRYRTRIFAPNNSDITLATHAAAVDPTGQASFTDLLTLRGDTGNVGIGTTAPAAKLDVVGGMRIDGAGNGITFPDGSTQTTATPVHTFAACSSDQASPPACGCSYVTESMPIKNGSSCQVTADSGSCSAVSTGGINGETFGICCVCSPINPAGQKAITDQLLR
jgi:hypothetical protein